MFNLIRTDLNGKRRVTKVASAIECVETLFEEFPNVVIDNDPNYTECFDAFCYTATTSWIFSIQPVGFRL